MLLFLINSVANYSKENFELMLMQLPDYLAWESKEGGPYMYISDIKLQNSQRQSIPQREYAEHYKLFLKAYNEFPAQLQLRPVCHNFHVERNDKMVELITAITKTEYLENYDEVRKVGVSAQQGDAVLRAKRINDSISSTSILKFKGKDVYGKVEYEGEMNTEKKGVKKIAPNEIINYIIQQLNLNLNTHHASKIFGT